MKRKAPPGPAMWHCRNEMFGCGHGFESAAFNRRANACNACCHRQAHRWRVAVKDLDFLVVAWTAARALADGEEPAPDQVFKNLAKMGIGQTPAADWVLPEGDRAEAE